MFARINFHGDRNFCKRFPMVKKIIFQKQFLPFDSWDSGEYFLPGIFPVQKFSEILKKSRSLLISIPSNTVTVLSQFCEYTVNPYRKKAWVEALKSLIPQYSCRERSCPPVGKRVGVNHVRSSKLKIRVIVWHENPLIELMKKWMNFEEKVNFEGWRRRFRKNDEFDKSRKRIWKGNYDSCIFMTRE